MKALNDLFAAHPRRWRDFLYVYPVIARRSRGLSLGVNLCPDAACPFHCVYCSVDRRVAPATKTLDLNTLDHELRTLAANWMQLFDESEFRATPPEYRRLNDIAFSGDGEPTAVPAFLDAVRLVAAVRRDFALDSTKIVLITNACCLTRPSVVDALAVLDQNAGEIWAKLDAGTEEHFRRVNRAAISLQTILDNILATARVRPIVIQSMFVRLSGEPASPAELAAYLARLRALLDAGARLALIQVYTVARWTTESYVAPLTAPELESIAEQIRPLGVPVAVFS